MLQALYIRNFALIDDVEVSFGPGFNVITGETGSGKSMLIDSLQIALGGRASVDFIRIGREKATVQATFDLSRLGWFKERAGELGIDLEGEDLLILSREITRGGKNYCRINGRLVSLNIYREASSGLVDMLGQHEQQTLLNRDRHGYLLDRLGGPELLQQLQVVSGIYRRWQEYSRELERLEGGARETARRLDMLNHQVKEIDKANLSLHEEEELLKERHVLINAERITRLTGDVIENLYRGGKGVTAAVDTVARSVNALKELAQIDSNLQVLTETVESVLYQLEDTAREVASYRDSMEYNPERLDQIEYRLSLIKQLQYKYGSTIDEILQYRETAANELKALANVEEKTSELSAKISSLEREWYLEAGKLGELRLAAARELEGKAEAELQQLEMAGAEFRVGLINLKGLNPGGSEETEFLISSNAGEPPRPLQKVASGGELSRIMLALKVLMAGVDEVPTLVFDEVDTGVGGKALQAIGEKLSQLSEGRQVICVTHAPQVACFADEHYLISKTVNGGLAQTNVCLLEEKTRVEELARMMAGREITEIVVDHARQMLNLSTKYKG